MTAGSIAAAAASSHSDSGTDGHDAARTGSRLGHAKLPGLRQEPLPQDSPGGHTLPQRPQLYGSNAVLLQGTDIAAGADGAATIGADGAATIVQAPNVQGTPNGHWLLQPPQWFVSAWVLMH